MKKIVRLGAGARALIGERSRGRTFKQPRAGAPRGKRNPKYRADLEWFDDRAHRLALCLMAARRVPDAPKGPNLYRAAQDAVLMLLCRDPLDGDEYRRIEDRIIHDRETVLHGFDNLVQAQQRLAENGSIVRDVKRVYTRLRKDSGLADHVRWLRGRLELRAIVDTFTDKLVDGDALPDRA